MASELGFEACGFAKVEPVAINAQEQYATWIKQGKHSTMQYMEKYSDVRANPALLLENASSIIAVALNYYPQQFQPKEAPQFAYYAYGLDYHEVIRAKLQQMAAKLEELYGATSRACVDTAPLRERYWAQRSGIGFVGRNNQLIIPGKGSYFFLGFLITTLEIEPDQPCTLTCGNCRRCVACCPTKALNDEGAVDARRCISCLSIEYRGELPDDVDFGNRIYGCDTCQKSCPHNRNTVPTSDEAFAPSTEFLNLNRTSIASMSDDDFRRIFRHSAVRRLKLPQLLRNLKHCK